MLFRVQHHYNSHYEKFGDFVWRSEDELGPRYLSLPCVLPCPGTRSTPLLGHCDVTLIAERSPWVLALSRDDLGHNFFGSS